MSGRYTVGTGWHTRAGDVPMTRAAASGCGGSRRTRHLGGGASRSGARCGGGGAPGRLPGLRPKTGTAHSLFFTGRYSPSHSTMASVARLTYGSWSYSSMWLWVSTQTSRFGPVAAS